MEIAVSEKGTVTQWFEEVEQGDSAAAQALWERYFPELVRLAREKLGGSPRAAADEEDIALSVMDSLFDAAQQNRFPNLADRDDLWRLLIRMTARKVVDLRRHQSRQRRGGGKVLNESSLRRPTSDVPDQTLAQVVGTTPTPEFAVMVAEEYRERLEQLEDRMLQSIAIAKMQGYENREIARQLDCSVRTIERRLELIRRKWDENQAHGS
jgi:DNA-directed RNA polymerase specialized sigma24 family protein